MFDIDLLTDTIQLLLAGKLFREPGFVIRQFAIGVLMASVIFILLLKLGVGLTMSVIITSVVAGIIQPFLLKNIKFA